MWTKWTYSKPFVPVFSQYNYDLQTWYTKWDVWVNRCFCHLCSALWGLAGSKTTLKSKWQKWSENQLLLVKVGVWKGTTRGVKAEHPCELILSDLSLPLLCDVQYIYIIVFSSSILWTKYGILTDDVPLCSVGIIGMILQSTYLLFYYLNTRDKVSWFLHLLCHHHHCNAIFPNPFQ